MSDLLLKMPNVYEPKKKNRFLIRFPSDLGVQEWYVESAKRPSIQTNSVEIPFLNTSTWVAGSYKWQEMQVTFRDPIGPSATQALMEWIRLCDESVTGRQGYAVSTKGTSNLRCLILPELLLKNGFLSDAGSQPMTAEISHTTMTDLPRYRLRSVRIIVYLLIKKIIFFIIYLSS